MASRYADRNLREPSIIKFLREKKEEKVRNAQIDAENFDYFRQTGEFPPNTRMNESLSLIPSGKIAKPIQSGLGSLSKYFSNLFGTTAKKTSERVAANSKNIAKNLGTKIKEATKLNKARAGNNSIPNTIKETAAKTRFKAAKETNKKLLNKVTKQAKADKLAKKARKNTRVATAIPAAAIAIEQAFEKAGTSKQGEGTIGPSGTDIENSQLRDVVQDPNVFAPFLDTWGGRRALIDPNTTTRGAIQLRGGEGYYQDISIDGNPNTTYKKIPTFLTDMVPSSGVQKGLSDEYAQNPLAFNSKADMDKLDAIVNAGSDQTSYYGEEVPLGDPNGRFIPGYAGARVNEVGSNVRPIPPSGPANAMEVIAKAAGAMPKDFRISSDGAGNQSQTETSLEAPKTKPFGRGMSHAQRLEYLANPDAYNDEVDGVIRYE